MRTKKATEIEQRKLFSQIFLKNEYYDNIKITTFYHHSNFTELDR